MDRFSRENGQFNNPVITASRTFVESDQDNPTKLEAEMDTEFKRKSRSTILHQRKRLKEWRVKIKENRRNKKLFESALAGSDGSRDASFKCKSDKIVKEIRLRSPSASRCPKCNPTNQFRCANLILEELNNVPVPRVVLCSHHSLESNTGCSFAESALHQQFSQVTLSEEQREAQKKEGKEKVPKEETLPKCTTCTQERQRQKKFCQKKKKAVVKFGDHSVHWTGVLATLSCYLPNISSKDSNAFKTMYYYIYNGFNNIVMNNESHSYRILSAGFRGMINGAVRNSFEATWDEAISARPTATMLDSHVTFGHTAFERHTRSTLDLGTQGRNTNSVGILYTLRANITPHNLQIFESFSRYLNETYVSYDMSAFYAKMLFYMFIRKRFEDENVEPQIRVLDSDDNYKWIDITVDLQYDVLSKLCDSQIILCSWDGYSRKEEYMFKIIHSPHRYYLNTPACDGNRKIAGLSYILPAIPIVYFSNGAPSNPPNLALPLVITASMWHDLAFKIAERRNETDCLLKGLYLAMELAFSNAVPRTAEAPPAPYNNEEPVNEPNSPAVNTYRAQMSQNAIAAQDSHIAVTCYYERGGIVWPRPREIKFLNRLYNPNSLHPYMMSQEFDYIFLMDVNMLQKIGALVSGLVRIMFATILFQINLNARDLERWVRQDNVPNMLYSLMIMKGFAGKQRIDFGNSIAGIFQQTFNLMEKCTGIIPSYDAIKNRSWNMNVPDALFGQDGEYLAHTNPLYTPRFGCVLAINYLINEYPAEWGMGDAGPLVNFASEIGFRINTMINGDCKMNWRAYLGEKEYDEIAISDHPYKLITYGASSLNIISQQFYNQGENKVPLPIRWNEKYRTMIICSHNWNKVERDAPEWNVELGTYELLTIGSYDWDTDTILSPQIDEDALHKANWNWIRCNDKIQANLAGIFKFNICLSLVPPVLNSIQSKRPIGFGLHKPIGNTEKQGLSN